MPSALLKSMRMKTAKLVPYEPKHRSSVVACLRRNYEWMGNAAYEKVDRWVDPILTYEWAEPADTGYPHGGVLLDQEDVVGFLGMIYSVRYPGGERCIYANPTTWAIDPGYRIYDFPSSDTLYGLADVIADFTAGEVEIEKSLKMFGFRICDDKSHFFRRTKVSGKLSCVQRNPSDIHDEILRREFEDHLCYGVECLDFADDSGRDCLVFVQKKTPVNPFLDVESYANVVRCKDREFMRLNLKDIIGIIQEHLDTPAVKIDSRFIAGGSVEDKTLKYHTDNIIRVIFDKGHTIDCPDYFYSERILL